MSEQHDDRFVIDYAPPEREDEIPFIRPMLQWRRTCGVFFLVLIAGFFLWTPVAMGAGAVAAVAGVLTLVYMGRAALTEAGAGYATRQIVLAVALSAACFLGVWLVPLLVWSDLLKWRAIEEQNREAE